MSFPRKRESIIKCCTLCHSRTHFRECKLQRESIFCISSHIFFLSLSLRTFEESVAISLLLYIFHLYLSFILNQYFAPCIFLFLHFCIISSHTYNPNPLFLYKLNTKYQRLTPDFNKYALFLCNILPFFATKTIKKLYFL